MAALVALAAPFFTGAAGAIGKALAWLARNPAVLAIAVVAALAWAVSLEHGAVLKARAALASQRQADAASLARCQSGQAALGAALGRQNAAVAAIAAAGRQSQARAAAALARARSASAAYSTAEARILAATARAGQSACQAADALILNAGAR